MAQAFAVIVENGFTPFLRLGNSGRHRVISECHHFALQLNHFIPGFLSYSFR
jgi:hypothetical protein